MHVRPPSLFHTFSYSLTLLIFVVLAFSAGARGCIGSRFALVESVCILAILLRRFEVLLPPEAIKMQDAGKSWDEVYKWMTKWTIGVTIQPVNAKVGVKRRES